jgi:MFS family permease
MLKLYVINFLLAVSTTIGMTIIPLLATQNLGLSLLFLGLIEGGSELISNGLKFYSGYLFDKIQNKKLLFVVSIVIAFLSKVLLLLSGVSYILGSKVFERFANGLFATPRDAFVGVNSPNVGTSISLMVGFKTLGCVLGAFTISVVSYNFGIEQNLKYIILFTCILNVVAFILSLFIKNNFEIKVSEKLQIDNKELFKVIYSVLPIIILSTLFFLGRFNDGMIILYLKKLDFQEWFYTSTIGIFNFSMYVVAPFIGYFVDKNKNNLLITITILSLLMFNIIFFFLPVNNMYLGVLGLLCWGVQRTSAQILFTSLIFKSIPKKFYGSVLGVYSVIMGIAVLLASAMGGNLANYNFSYLFIQSGFMSVVTLMYFFFVYRKNNA